MWIEDILIQQMAHSDSSAEDKLVSQTANSIKQELLKRILPFVDGERIISADTKEEQINAQGKNQAYDIVEDFIKNELWEK